MIFASSINIVRHICTPEGVIVTEATYRHEGKPASARIGHAHPLDARDMADILNGFRRRAAMVVYVERGA